MNFVADTHALLWWFTDSPKISSRASEIFEKCEKGENVIFIPSIVIAESLSIFDKKRISFNFKNLLKKIHTRKKRGGRWQFCKFIHLPIAPVASPGATPVPFSEATGQARGIWGRPLLP